jgi:hypothetical protein
VAPLQLALDPLHLVSVAVRWQAPIPGLLKEPEAQTVELE